MSESQSNLVFSVRNFVSPVQATGSIDSSFSLQTEDSLTAGTSIHAAIQKRLAAENPCYKNEVFVSKQLEHDCFSILVRGRIDGIFEPSIDGPLIVEEIKSTYRLGTLLSSLEIHPNHPYTLQTLMYAHLLYLERQCVPECRLRLVSMLDDSETLVPIHYNPTDFQIWINKQIVAIKAEEILKQQRFAQRREIASKLTFPFSEMRPHQQELISRVNECIENGEKLLLQAPTGLGKTAAVLYPAIDNALRNNKMVFYATPRNSQHSVAEDFITRLRKCGNNIRSVTLRAKERVCRKDEVNCKPEYCEYANSYYDKLSSTGVLESLDAIGFVNAAVIDQFADSHELCPFELALDFAKRCDVVISDYNYIFAPRATLQRFFAEPDLCQKNIVLIDEAHNLATRAMDWFSPALSLAKIDALISKPTSIRTRQLKVRYKRVLRRCRSIVANFQGPDRLVEIVPEEFLAEEKALGRILTDAFAAEEDIPPSDPSVESYYLWKDFCDTIRIPEKSLLPIWKENEATLKIMCADASWHLRDRVRLVASMVAFSATLKPFEFHASLCGFNAELTPRCEFPSPFPKVNRKIIAIPQVSTAWKDRTTSTPKIAEILEKIIQLQQGNYFIFFPSYQFLHQVFDQIHLPGFDCFAQPRNASHEQIATIRRNLEQNRNVVVFAVQGGSFAEGIDLPGDELIGAIVVGPPLPTFDFERESLKRYYQQKYGSGFQFAYVFPAMAKAVQAAGRVIRTPTDRGILVLIDRRFLQPDYARCMPADWFYESPQELVSQSILKDVATFWEAKIEN